MYAGEGPARSAVLDAWLVATDEGRKLRIASNAEGTELWLTGEEAERLEKTAERREKEAERREKEAERREKEAERREKETAQREREAALARIAELEAQLAKRSS